MEDIFKKSFLEGFASAEITTLSFFAAITITALLGLYIYYFYKIFTRKTFYSKNFNISLVIVAIITTAIICTIQSSVVVSLGMVGALSIVRFRTAVKDPMDLAFLFWSISVGIICGAGFAIYAMILSLGISAVFMILEVLPSAKPSMILTVCCNNSFDEKSLEQIIKKHASHYEIKSRRIDEKFLNLTIELRTKEGSILVKEISLLEGILNTNLLIHNSETSL